MLNNFTPKKVKQAQYFQYHEYIQNTHKQYPIYMDIAQFRQFLKLKCFYINIHELLFFKEN